MTYCVRITAALICRGSTRSAVNSAVDFNGDTPIFKSQLKRCGERSQSSLHAAALNPAVASNIYIFFNFFFTAVTR